MIPKIPPLSFLPKYLVANLTPKPVFRFIEGMPPLPGNWALYATLRSFKRHLGTHNPPELVEINGEHQTSGDAHVPHPEEDTGLDVGPGGSDTLHDPPSHGLSNGAAQPRSPLIIPAIPKQNVPMQRKGGPEWRHLLGSPRPSNMKMEYARLALLEKAKSAKDGRPCELPTPISQISWAAHRKNVVITSRLPICVQRDLASKNITDATRVEVDSELDEAESDAESVETVKPEPQRSHHPRLSLHLDDEPVFATFMDISSSGEDDEEPSGSTNFIEERNHSDDLTQRGRNFKASDSIDGSITTIRDTDDSEGRMLLPGESHPHSRSVSHLDYSTPRAKTKVIEYSPLSCATSDSPLARFSISAQPTHRLTPDTLTRRVVGDAGGQLHVEDSRHAQLIHSLGTELPQESAADFWDDAEADPMIPELQPKPLKIKQREPLPNLEEGYRWSRLFDGLGTDVPVALEDFGTATPLESGPDTMEERDGSPPERDQMVRGLKPQTRNFTDSDALMASRGPHRSVSTAITPTQPLKSIARKASFNPEKGAPSEFTPEHHREVVEGGTVPRSGLMLSLRDTRSRLRHPLREAEEARLSKREDVTSHTMRSITDVPDRHQQRAALRDLERAVAAAPLKPRSLSLWGNSRVKDHEDPATLADSSILSSQTQSTLRDDSVQTHRSSTTRDFSQPSKLQKKLRHKLSARRFDASTNISSPMPLDQALASKGRNTPSPSASQRTSVPPTPSSTIGSLFRMRVRSEHNGPTTPRTPASPRMHWRPFDEPEPEPPCSSPWMSGQVEDKQEKAARLAYFRAKAELEFEGKESPKKSSRKSSLGSSTKSKEDTKQKHSGLDHRQSMESLVAWKSFIDVAPEPLFSSPRPPVPPLPSESELNLTVNRLPQAPASLRADSAVDAGPVAAYRTKKPQGLQVETRKLRKASRDAQRTPSSTPKTATLASRASGGGLRAAFRLDGGWGSSGRTAKDAGERQLEGRDDEVVSRRR
ncbi:hypothetical protein FDECE_13099 [Fusarium decemcellulare]|nr:hypothetical protein FDECE_13099 [Fusarium decemcellulare]